MTDKPVLNLAADAAQFDDATYQAALNTLRPHFRVGGSRPYQFTELPPARVIIEFAVATLQAIPAELLGSVLYDALKLFLKPRAASTTILNLRLRVNGGVTELRLETNDAEVLHAALTGLKVTTGKGSSQFEFNTNTRSWLRKD